MKKLSIEEKKIIRNILDIRKLYRVALYAFLEDFSKLQKMDVSSKEFKSLYLQLEPFFKSHDEKRKVCR